MRKILNKYSCVFFFFFIGGGVMLVIAQGSPPEQPPGFDCCPEAWPNEPGHQAYLDCLKYYEENPGASCDATVPIDNSRYVFLSVVAGVALASFVIARRIKN